MTTMILAWMLGARILVWSGPESGAEELPPEAAMYNERGIASIRAGDLAGGIDELERSYRAMADPQVYRAGRDMVLGSLRSALNQRYAETGDPAHLRRLQGILQEHLAGLQAAPGADAAADDIAGTRAALGEVEAALASAPPPEPAAAAAPVEEAPLSNTSAPVSEAAAPAADRVGTCTGRGLRIGGDVMLGAGFVGLGVMAYGLVVHFDSRHKLQSLTNSLVEADRPATSSERADGDALHRRATDHQTLAIAAGVAGGVALITGVALRVAGMRRARALAVAPVVLPRFAGLAVRVRF